MKLRLLILLAAAALAAPAAGQTIKSLGYNTTNGQVVYSGSNSLTFTNALQFSTNARATTRTNLGGTTVGNAVFTAATTNAARTALGASIVGGNIFTVPEQYQELYLRINADNTVSSLTPAATRTNLGLGGSDSVTFSNLSLNSNGSLAIGGMNVTAITSGIDLAFKRAGSTELELKTNGLILHVGSYSFSGGNSNGASTTRTNLGLGGTNTVTFSNIQLNSFPGGGSTGFVGHSSGQLTLYGTNVSTSVPAFYGYDGFNNTAFSAATARTNLELGATNNVTFSNVTASGTLTTTGNATLNGSDNLMPNATTASSASSLMTRVLTDNNPIQTIGTVRPLGAYGFSTANGGTGSTDHAFGGGNVRSGTNTNGSGRATLYRGLNNNNNFTGGGISAQNMSVSFLFAINDTLTTNSVARLIVGGTGFTGAAPAPANSNALSARGFGVEIARTSTTNVWPAPSLRARLFAHDGTNYYTSDYTADFNDFDVQTQFIINYRTNGTVTLQASHSNRAPSRPSATPVLTLTNGPTTTFGSPFIDWVAVNRSDIAPAASLHTIYYGGMVEVKD